MKITQHNSPTNPSLHSEDLSDNLRSFLSLIQERFSFDAANIYHVTNENLHLYKHVIVKAITSNLREHSEISVYNNQDNFIKNINDEFENIMEANIFPKSLIVFDYGYMSTVESFMVFFEENNDLLSINTKFSTLPLGDRSFFFDRIEFPDGRSYPPVLEALCYESSTSYGFFPLVSYLLPVNIDKSHFELSSSFRPHKKAELQIRLLDSGQDKRQNLKLPPNFDIHQYIGRYYDRPKIFNTQLIYNNEIIFSDYNIVEDKKPHDVVLEKLLPFSTDFKRDFEIVDAVPVAVTSEYYEHFKKNIWPVIEMAKC